MYLPAPSDEGRVVAVNQQAFLHHVFFLLKIGDGRYQCKSKGR